MIHILNGVLKWLLLRLWLVNLFFDFFDVCNKVVDLILGFGLLVLKVFTCMFEFILELIVLISCFVESFAKFSERLVCIVTSLLVIVWWFLESNFGLIKIFSQFW